MIARQKQKGGFDLIRPGNYMRLVRASHKTHPMVLYLRTFLHLCYNTHFTWIEYLLREHYGNFGKNMLIPNNT